MDSTGIPLFDAAEKRLAWTDRRQAILARNIANVNTPGFMPGDLAPFSLSQNTAEGIQPVRTDRNHMLGTLQSFPDLAKSSHPLHAADKNSVALDQQLTKVSETETTQALTISIYKKYMSLFTVAAGHSS